jgi:hypothetical protein
MARRDARRPGLALAAFLAAAALAPGATSAQTAAVAAPPPDGAWLADADAAAAALARGDAAWAQRHAGADADGRARPEPIAAAVAAYDEAIAAAPDALAPRWRLVRALYFAGDFASATPADADRALDRATEASERAKDALGRRVGGREVLAELEAEALRAELTPEEVADAAALHFWSAVAWAAWGREHGLVGAVREGLAGRIHRDAEAALVLDEGVEQGGALRLLARLHATLPRIPFVSPWVDPARALPALERALELAPAHPGNRLLYAFTLLELAPERRGDALALLEELAALEPRAEERCEDAALRRAARERLAAERPGDV